MNTLRINELSFGYRASTNVLNDFSLTLTSGTTVLLGPNGAGKTSLISLCASVLKPSKGRIDLVNSAGEITSTRQLRDYRAKVAWLPQDFTPVAGLSVSEHVQYAAWLKGLTKRQARLGVDAALESVELSALADRPAKALSGGQRQRLGLAGALAHDAQLILLDEPSAGLDPVQREKLRSILAAIPSDKVVLVSTHQTEDIDGTYDDVVVLDGERSSTRGLSPISSRRPSHPQRTRETESAAHIPAW